MLKKRKREHFFEKKEAKTKNENIIFSKREELLFCSRKADSARDTDGENNSCLLEDKGCSKEHIFNFSIWVENRDSNMRTKEDKQKQDYVK